MADKNIKTNTVIHGYKGEYKHKKVDKYRISEQRNGRSEKDSKRTSKAEKYSLK